MISFFKDSTVFDNLKIKFHLNSIKISANFLTIPSKILVFFSHDQTFQFSAHSPHKLFVWKQKLICQ